MEEFLLWVVQKITAYGFNKGLDKLFKNKETFSNHLYKLISETISDYEKKFPQIDSQGNFAFYKSQIIIEEFLKFRLFEKKGYSINTYNIQSALEKNSNIIKPSTTELEYFFEIFDNKINNDEKLKELEIEKFHKEKIFEIYDKVGSVLALLESHLVEVVGLLEEEYRAEINDCIIETKTLKLQTALKRIEIIENRIETNSKHVSEKLKANLAFLKGICFESLGNINDSRENFIKAYKLSPENFSYLERACITYYFLKDNKFQDLKALIESQDEYNPFCWLIKVLEGCDKITFIKEQIPPIVKEKHRFKRLIFNNLLKDESIDTKQLLESLEVDKIPRELPDSINYDNFHHWVFILNTVSFKYFITTEVLFWSQLKKKEDSLYFLQLLRILTNTITNSELDKSYNVIVFMYYWLESEIDFNKETILNLTTAYENLNEKDSFRTLLFANSIQKHIGFKEAIDIIEKFKGDVDENLISLKTFCQLNISESDDSYKEYFSLFNEIDSLNIQNIVNFLLPICSFKKDSKENLLKLFDSKVFKIPAHQKLINLLIESLYKDGNEVEISEIDQLKEDLSNEDHLFFLIALIYYENKYFKECSAFIKSYINEDKESRDLLFYIRALDSQKSTGQLELLRLLKLWRENFSFNDYLLRMELELRQILKDTNEIKIICEYALNRLPQNEKLYTLYLISLSILKLKPEIHKQVEKIKGFTFNNTENALRIAGILIDNGYEGDGLELLYQKAKKKSDSVARINYFMVTNNLPREYFIAFDTVEKERYVKYEIDREVKTLFINDESLSNPLVEQSLGKRVLETFSIESKLSRKILTVKILSIMNKYLALNDEIINEASSSFSSLPVESIKFDGTDIASIEKTLIENYGAADIERRKHFEKNLNDYYLYNISFTELVSSNFEGTYVDAYYYLTSYEGNGFYVTPLKFINRHLSFDNQKLIIDFSSGLLFFELSTKLNINFNEFIIAESLIPLIDNLIFKAESQRNTKMSISILENKIIPHFYSEDFHNNRIKFLSNIKEWFLNNAKAIVPTEKIDFIRPIYENGKISPSFEFFLDTSFLAQREDSILISDDLGYNKFMHLGNKISSTEFFLLTKFPDKKQLISEYYLSNKYVGISINRDLLYSTYIESHKSGAEYVYNYVLRNISSKENFNPLNILIVVDFLKDVALNSAISYEKYQLDATNILAMLISSFPNPSFSLTLKERIEQKFQLLGMYYDLTRKSLLDALRILNRLN